MSEHPTVIFKSTCLKDEKAMCFFSLSSMPTIETEYGSQGNKFHNASGYFIYLLIYLFILNRCIPGSYLGFETLVYG